MDVAVKLPENCEGMYNRKHLIGMLYVDGYKENPVHLRAKDEDDMVENMKYESARIDRLMRDSAYLRKSCGGK